MLCTFSPLLLFTTHVLCIGVLSSGVLGPRGPPGPIGPIGSMGDKGQLGDMGLLGEKGQKGEEGQRGLTGARGGEGLKGIKGNIGQMGPKGVIPGIPGSPGVEGRRGETGPPGPPGIRGIIGLKGLKGDKGTVISGPPGHQGYDGPKGNFGLPGIPGPPGIIGSLGKWPTIGKKGMKGMKGSKGITGLPGNVGPVGRSITVIDEDECLSNPCSQECFNTFGSFFCSCKSGYSLLNSQCEDIDECSAFPRNPCQHKCENIAGSFRCSCLPGFYLVNDARTCIDIDECARKSVHCPDLCLNTPGGYACVNSTTISNYSDVKSESSLTTVALFALLLAWTILLLLLTSAALFYIIYKSRREEKMITEIRQEWFQRQKIDQLDRSTSGQTAFLPTASYHSIRNRWPVEGITVPPSSTLKSMQYKALGWDETSFSRSPSREKISNIISRSRSESANAGYNSDIDSIILHEAITDIDTLKRGTVNATFIPDNNASAGLLKSSVEDNVFLTDDTDVHSHKNEISSAF